MSAHATPVCRPSTRVFTTVFAVVVLHVLVLWWVQRSVLPVAQPPMSASQRVSVRLVPLQPAARQATAQPLRGAPRRAAPAPTPSPSRFVQTAPPVPTAVLAQASPAATPVTAPSLPTSVGDAPQPGGQPAATGGGTAPVAVATGSDAGGSTGQAGAKLERPSSSAHHLRNPQPEYPRISRQRGEQGRVVVNVLIGVDGSAQQAELITSSGFDRLDQAALSTVRGWRYVPGKRAGVPEAMWFAVPIQFVIQ